MLYCETKITKLSLDKKRGTGHINTERYIYYLSKEVLLLYQQLVAGISRIRNDLEQIRTIAQQLEQNERANQQALGQMAQREGYAAQKLHQIENLASNISQQATQMTSQPQPQVGSSSYQPVGLQQSGISPAAQSIFHQTIPSTQQSFSQVSPQFESFQTQQLQPQQQQTMEALRQVTKQQQWQQGQQFSPSSVQGIGGQQPYSQ